MNVVSSKVKTKAFKVNYNDTFSAKHSKSFYIFYFQEDSIDFHDIAAASSHIIASHITPCQCMWWSHLKSSCTFYDSQTWAVYEREKSCKQIFSPMQFSERFSLFGFYSLSLSAPRKSSGIETAVKNNERIFFTQTSNEAFVNIQFQWLLTTRADV